MLEILFGDNLIILKNKPDKIANLIYIDPPFNTGKTQKRNDLNYDDSFEDFKKFIYPRMEMAYRLLKDNGSLFFHIDYREVHYCKVWLDEIFGRDNFLNEIIWAYDYGGRPKNKWPPKHDNILWYTKNKDDYVFNYDQIDRIPYMAPGLVTKEKAERGKTLTSVWWNTIVHTTGKEKTGYPTQKPLAIIERIIKVHSNPGDLVLDFFAGSGTTGEAALKLDRKCILVDQNPDAIKVIKKRLNKYLIYV